jgi:diamine N-acetyltransferase
VRLRALEPEDAELMYAWENDPGVWDISGTIAPFSRETIRQFIENQQYDIYHTQQMRLVICRLSDTVIQTAASSERVNVCDVNDVPVGMIDIFDFDPVNLRAGVGILICDEAERRKGYAGEALELVVEYATAILGLHQLWCRVGADNFSSLELFRGKKFAETGVMRDWSRRNGLWRDEIMFQRILTSLDL